MSKSFHIVAIGGGGGATQVLKAAQPFADHLTAIIAVTDTGRSTGLARAIGGIPAPGDLRATIALILLLCVAVSLRRRPRTHVWRRL